MTLLEIHAELSVTNALLTRIADALDRAIPLALSPPDHSAHPLVGVADVSRMTPERSRDLSEKRATMSFRASEHVRFSDRADNETAKDRTDVRAPEVSVTGAWDHDDPLDSIEEFDRPWENYPG